MKDIYHGINCNVSNCVYNERGCNCNLERVCVSKGEGDGHFCRSYIPLVDKKEEETIYHDDSSSLDEYFLL